jgi:8-oxo-dGTP diphosphatase
MVTAVVVTAAIIQKEGLVLIAQRLASSRLEAGKWEFPGGKLEAGETPEEGIVREIREELDLEIAVDRLFMVHPFTYERDGRVSPIELHVFLAWWVGGEGRCVECQDFRWVLPSELVRFSFVAGDIKIVESYLAFVNGE